ncbi:unnamed protein product [Cuscuta epithymum]|uniref:Uncharacterized protein n=1 Tax=Cuscuta epithymum TaxID=186058 RepID=A0AAV0CH04_9ASTE|nr:unnamed protein product [Cuscuta epithymum]
MSYQFHNCREEAKVQFFATPPHATPRLHRHTSSPAAPPSHSITVVGKFKSLSQSSPLLVDIVLFFFRGFDVLQIKCILSLPDLCRLFLQSSHLKFPVARSQI